VCGSHGLEPSDADVRPERAGGDPGGSDALDALLREHPAVLIERKPFGLALHYRAAPLAERTCHAVAETIAAKAGWRVQPGKMVVELTPAGVDKGGALSAYMTRPGFAGTRPVMIGDDLTDEPAFAMAQALGGLGVLVGARPTSARYRLLDVAAVHAWLEAGVR